MGGADPSFDDPAAWLGVGLDSPRLSERAISIARASSSRSPHQRIKEGKNPSYSDEVRRGLARHYILVSCPFPLRCSTSSYRVSSSLAWCCLRSRPRALIKSQFNERRGAAPGALFSQSKPSRNRVLYHRQLEPNVTLLPSIRSWRLRRSRSTRCCLVRITTRFRRLSALACHNCASWRPRTQRSMRSSGMWSTCGPTNLLG